VASKAADSSTPIVTASVRGSNGWMPHSWLSSSRLVLMEARQRRAGERESHALAI
jgi:hypothetical protein